MLQPNLCTYWTEHSHLELELEVYIWWFYSTHVYYKTTNYELLTPTLSAPSSMSLLWLGEGGAG